MKKKNNGFTLVELIVVITILAILGTISFVSVQGYSQAARNSLRLDNISKMATVVENFKNEGKNLLAFTGTGSEVTELQVGGTGAIINYDYRAGEYNAISLNLSEGQFIDPQNGKKYLLGVNNKKRGVFQIATVLEEGENLQAKVVGNYSPRSSTLIAGSGTTGNKKYTLGNYGDIGKFFMGDYLTGATVPTGMLITDISSDGMTLTLSDIFTGDISELGLRTDESLGLIGDLGGTNPVINGSSALPYALGSNSSGGGGIADNSSSGGGGGISSGAGDSSGGGAADGPAGAQGTVSTWLAMVGSASIIQPDSDAYNNFTANSAANNTNITIVIGNQNSTIDTRYGNDTITTGYGNNDISDAGGNNVISVGDGYNDIFLGNSGSNTLTLGNGGNEITSNGGNLIVNGGNGNNTFTIGYGNTIQMNLGNGNNTINANGGSMVLTFGAGNNDIVTTGYMQNNTSITFGNGTNSFTGVGGNTVIHTGTSGSSVITFGGNQSQQLIWKGGNVTVNDYWRYGNNRVSFANIADINNCSDVISNMVLSGTTATITSSQGILTLYYQDLTDTNINCNSNMIF